MNYNVGFIMDQVAGYVTSYKNLRKVAEHDPEIQATWHEIYYYRDGGWLEKIRQKLPFVPSYLTGVLRGSFEVWKALRAGKYEVLYTNTSVCVFFGWAFRKTPTLIDFDSTPLQIDRMEAYGSSHDPAPIAWLKWRLFRGALHSATILQATSNWAKQSAIDEYGVPPERLVVNPHGIDLKFWQPALAACQDKDDQPLKVLFVGADFRRKGGPLLLDWYKTQNPERVELHIVTRETIEPQAGVHTYYEMQPNTPELLRLYQTSDLFVLPSLGECFGIATIEAMGTGLPVIASDVGGTADIIVPERNGYIVPGNDLQALSEAITKILGDTTRRQAMGQQSRQLAEERFDLEKNARRTFEYLKQIAKKKE